MLCGNWVTKCQQKGKSICTCYVSDVYCKSETFGKSYSGESKYDTMDCKGLCECTHI